MDSLAFWSAAVGSAAFKRAKTLQFSNLRLTRLIPTQIPFLPPEKVPEDWRTPGRSRDHCRRFKLQLRRLIETPASSEKMGAHDCRQGLQIEQGEKINRAKLPIDRGRPADFRADREVSAKQLWHSRLQR